MTSRAHAITPAERARIDQVDRLVVQGARGAPGLIAALFDPSWTVRRAAIAALASLGDDASQVLCTFLATRREDENAIAAAVDALSGSLGTAVLDRVLALLSHENPAVVADAAQILGRRHERSVAPALAQLLEHDNDNVAVAAIEALGAIGGTVAVDALIRVVEQRRFFRTFPAMQILARTHDPRAVPALAALIQDETYRFEAVRALGRTGAVQAIGPIVALLATPSDVVIRLVAAALADLIQRAEWAGSGERVATVLRETLAPSLGRLAGALRTADAEERIAIATVLGRGGDATVLPQIACLLDDSAAASAASDALNQLGQISQETLLDAVAAADPARKAALLPLVRARQAAPALRRLLGDEDAEVRARACEALARVGDETCVPQLFEVLSDRSPRVAHAAIAAIEALGAPETEALALEAARSRRSSVRRHALRIIGAFGYASAYLTLRQAVHDPDERVALLAIGAIGAIENPGVDEVLQQLAGSHDEDVRSAVMRSAAARGGARASALLVNGLADTSAWVRYYAVQGLGRIGVDAVPQAARLLVERLRDPAAQVRVVAIEALAQLGTPEAWDALCRAARSRDADERRASLIGIGMHARKGAAEILAEAARSPEAPTRLVALAGLAHLDDPNALVALDNAVGDADPQVRDAALSLLAERSDRASAQILVERALGADDLHPVHRALSRPSPTRVVAIVSRLTSADDHGAPVLLAALARMNTDASRAAMFEALAMDNPAARAAAASTLISIGAGGAHEMVAALAAGDPDPEVRRVCAAALTSA